MRRAIANLLLLAVLTGLAACDGSTDAPIDKASATAEASGLPRPARPDLAFCIARHEQSPDGWSPDGEGRDQPIALPAAFATVAANNQQVMAISTAAGGTLCEDLQWYYSVDKMGWLQSDRLLGWEWDGYEAFGYRLADRQGAGAIIETGVKPTLSPGGQRLASMQVSDAGFGGLEGFGVWQLTPRGLVSLSSRTFDSSADAPGTPVDDIGDWTLSGWSGEGCVNLAFARWDNDLQDYNLPNALPYHAAEPDNWEITPGQCP